MDPVQKAIWLVESHLRDPVTLDDIALGSGVSPYHLTRAFAAVTGTSLMRYARARRLSEAAKQLANGASDILAVALDAGYGSHEAFTRAFKEQFGLTPEQLRGQHHLGNITITEAIAMDATATAKLSEPRFETCKARLYAGLVERHDCTDSAGIPAQWQKFHPYFGAISGQVGDAAYGLSYDMDGDGNFNYLCGFEVTDFSGVPKGLSTMRVPPQKYAVFHQKDHIAAIRRVIATIFSTWMPSSGYEAADSPMVERYGLEFDPATGAGGFEIWLPVKG
jgi:AraC family transcriptional regulator